jgi:hypothetical protein
MAETPSTTPPGAFDDAANKVGDFLTGGWEKFSDALSNFGFFDKLTQKAIDTTFKNIGEVGKSMMEFATKASTQEYCWSCKTYKSLYDGLHQILVNMYESLVDKTTEIVGFAMIILMIVLCFKVLKIIASPFRENLSAEWLGVYTFLIRCAVIFPVFLFSSTTAGVKESGEFSPVSDLFISGPLALGTEIGVRLAQASCSIGKDGQLTALPICQAASATGSSSGSSTLTDLGKAHQAKAESILFTFHKIGVTGITGGIWTATQLPSSEGMGIISRGAYFIGGVILALIYFMLTITFGFRYVDALVRMMVVGSLVPIFVFLWIFEGTRSIAQKALRQVLFAATAFAVSGVIVVVAAYVIVAGYAQAFPNGGDVFSPAFWSKQQTGDFDWMAYFYIAGCALVVTNLSKAIFSIAAELVESNGMTGMGEQMENQTNSAKDMAQSTAWSLVRR